MSKSEIFNSIKKAILCGASINYNSYQNEISKRTFLRYISELKKDYPIKFSKKEQCYRLGYFSSEESLTEYLNEKKANFHCAFRKSC